MGLFDSIRDAIDSELAPTTLGISAYGGETSTLANPDPWLIEAFGGGSTASGKRVTPQTSMRVAAVYACVAVLSQSVGQLPFTVMQKTKNGGAEPADDHPLFQILQNLFSEEVTSQDGLELGMNHLCLRGNSYFQIVRDMAGRVQSLWPLHPDLVYMRRDDAGKLVYDYYPPQGGVETFDSREVWRTIGMTFNGIQGVSPITYAREAIGLAMSTEEHGSKLFRNGAEIGTVFEHPGKMSKEAQDRFRASIQAKYSGSGNSHGILVTEEGIKVSKLAMTSVDSQFIEARKFQLEEICRIFRVPPHMVQDLSRATFNNIEHLSINFVNSALMPWLVRFQKTAFRDLLQPAERKKLFFRFNTDSLLMGDSQAQANVASILIASRVINPNEARHKLGMNPYIGGDVYENPNTTAAKKSGDVAADPQKG